MRPIRLLFVTLALASFSACTEGSEPRELDPPTTDLMDSGPPIAPTLDAGPPLVPIDAGPDAAPIAMPDAGEASCAELVTSPEGVLTNLEGVRFTRTSGTLTLRTLRMIQIEGRSFHSARWWGEFENTGTSTVCIPRPVMIMHGADRLTVAEGTPYRFSGTVTAVCAAPGERGVIHGIENEVSPTFVEDLREIRYSITGLDGGRDAVPHPARPLLTELELRSSDLGTVYAGHGATSGRIRNLVLGLFGLDACGLILDEWQAYPDDALVRTGSFDFETFANDGMPVDVIETSSFIDDGSRTLAPAALPPLSPPDADAREELARREAWLRAALAEP